MAKIRKTTLQLYLSTGTKITVYFGVECAGQLEKDMVASMRRGYSFFPMNWEVEQMVVEDGDGRLMFGKDAGDPDVIDSNKIIGWSTSER